MRIESLIPLLAALGLSISTVSQATLIIDNFGVDQKAEATSTGGGNNTIALPGSSSVFNERQLTADLVSGVPAGDFALTEVSSNLGTFSGESQDLSVSGAFWRNSSGASVDLTEAGKNDAFKFDVLQNLNAGGTFVDFIFAVTSDGVGGSIVGQRLLNLPVSSGQILDIPLFDGNWLDSINGGTPVAIDWTAVTRVTLEVEGEGTSTDRSNYGLFLNSISVTSSVPTPGSVLLMSLGLVAVGAIKRRKRS